MQNNHRMWGQIMALGLLAIGPSCVDIQSSQTLEFDEDMGQDEQPGAHGALATTRHADAFPGFSVEISADDGDIVLSWSSPDPAGSTVVLRSTDPEDLVTVDLGALPPSVDVLIPASGAELFTDVGAASRTNATPNYFYRVASSSQSALQLSTMVMKVTTAVHPGYNKFGLCMLDGVHNASDLGAQFGVAVINTYMWSETTQSWLYWSSADGSGPFGDFSLPYGGVVTVQLDASTDPYLSLVGTVPTHEPFEVPNQTGLNLQTFPVLYDGPTSASYWVDQVGYWGIGRWNAQEQSRQWYWGPGYADIALEPCQPYYVQLPPEACTEDAQCNDGQYCRFDPGTSCGDFGAGICKPTRLACPDDDDPVCGCDEVTYANACEASVAGVSVAADGECSPACTEMDFFADADADGYGDANTTISACTPPAGYVSDDTDCDDTNAAVNPGATEVEGNGLDDDCDPATEDVMSCLPGGAVCDPFAVPNPCCAPNLCLIGPNRCLN